MSKFKPHYDVIVAGARCAGAATALLLAQAGAKVLLIDRQDARIRHHVDARADAHWRTSARSVGSLASGLCSEDTPPIGVTTFHYGSEQVRVAIKPEHGVHHLYAPRRTILDRILVEAAEAAGAEVQHGVVLSALQFDSSGRVIGALLRDDGNGESDVSADLVIGADGRNSTVAKLVGAETYLEGRASSAYRLWLFRWPARRRTALVFRRSRRSRSHPDKPRPALCFRRLATGPVRGRVARQYRAGVPRPS